MAHGQSIPQNNMSEEYSCLLPPKSDREIVFTINKIHNSQKWRWHSGVNCRVDSSLEFEASDYSVKEYGIAVLEDWSNYLSLLTDKLWSSLFFFPPIEN